MTGRRRCGEGEVEENQEDGEKREVEGNEVEKKEGGGGAKP